MAIFLDLPFWRTAIRGLGALLCNIIYNLISWIYQLFITVSRLNILSSDGVAPIYQRVTMILTIVMTFYITFEFVKYVIQPDTITDKEKGAGNILKRIIIVVVLIAFVPRLFTLAYRAQNIIIENQVISKVILGKKNVNFATFGNDFSANLLSIFYDVNESACQSGCNEEREIVNSNLDGLRKGEGLNLTQGIENSVSQSGEKIPTIRFDGILAIGVGVFILYILILYSIDVGIRYFQLLFLQIIAPIAIMGYMLPKKDNIFEKWYKQCFATYIDLFLRLAIIYFVLMIVQVLGDAMNAGTLFAGMDDVSGSIRTFAYIVLVMGLLAFAQRAPKLLGELFPSMGSKAGIGFGLKAGERVASGAARAIGAGTGGLTSMVKGGIARAANTRRSNIENLARRSSKADIARNRSNLKDKNNQMRLARTNLKNQMNNKNATDEERAEAQAAYINARKEQVEAQSKVAEDKNTRHRSVLGSAVNGALNGAVTGTKTGAGATKLSDIGKKVAEGTKKVTDDAATIQKYYDTGGTSELDRRVTHIQQSVGIQTASQRTAEEIRRLDAQIKTGESIINVQRNPKKAVDSAEERGQNKAKEGQLKLSAKGIEIKTGVKDASGNEIKIIGGDNENLGDIYQKFSRQAEEAKSKFDAVSKQSEALHANLEVAKLNNNEKEAQSIEQQISALNARIEELRNEATRTDTQQKAVLKNVSRAAFTQYLQSDNPTSIPGADAVMINHVENTKNNLERAFEEPHTREEVQQRINSMKASGDDKTIAKAEIFEKIINRDYKTVTFDDIDDIKNLLVNLSNERERELSITKAAKSTIETSSMYDAQKANADGGGKK